MRRPQFVVLAGVVLLSLAGRCVYNDTAVPVGPGVDLPANPTDLDSVAGPEQVAPPNDVDVPGPPDDGPSAPDGDTDLPDVDLPDTDVCPGCGDADADVASDADAEGPGPDGDGETIEPPPTCGPSLAAPAARSCTLTLTLAAPQGLNGTPTLPGDFNGWDETAQPYSDPNGDGIWETQLQTGAGAVLPGRHAYKVFAPGVQPDAWIRDPGNPLRIWDDTAQYENSLLVVPDCTVPLLTVEALTTDPAAGRIQLQVLVQAGNGGGTFTASDFIVTRNNEPFDDFCFNPTTQRLVIDLRGEPVPSKSLFRLWAEGPAGNSEELTVPVWLETEEFVWDDATLYFAFTDRFSDGDPTNNGTLDCANLLSDTAGWMGGDFEGVRQKLDYLDNLGVNAIWLSNPQDNPDGCYDGLISGKRYAAYHGYFPQSGRDPENHFGTLATLKRLVEEAHARGMRVLIDWSLNHVYESHPWATAHPDWINQPTHICREQYCDDDGCSDGWTKIPRTCWFERYLPDINYKKDGAVAAMVADAVWWIREANLDGFRVDAVKHVDDVAVYNLRGGVNAAIETTRTHFFMVGETFVWEWDWPGGQAVGTIARYVGPDKLDGQFDFPLYWRSLHAFAYRDHGLATLVDPLLRRPDAYSRTAIMSNFLGNHDVSRFISRADGTVIDLAGSAPFDPGTQSSPGLPPAGAEAYARLKVAFAFLMTAPGIPLIYYGDEIALPGRGDPDNRRLMTFTGWNDDQRQVHDRVAALGTARRSSRALRRGDIQFVTQESDHLAYTRRDGDAGAVVFLNRDQNSPWAASVSVAGAGFSDGQRLRDALGDTVVTVQGGRVDVQVPRQADGGAVVLLPE